jgi:hypothetical protein
MSSQVDGGEPEFEDGTKNEADDEAMGRIEVTKTVSSFLDGLWEEI